MNFSPEDKKKLLMGFAAFALVVVLSLLGLFIYSQVSRINNSIAYNKPAQTTDTTKNTDTNQSTQNKDTSTKSNNNSPQPNVQNSFNIVVPPSSKEIVTTENTSTNNDESLFPYSSSVKLTDENLKGLPKRYLALGRNEIYARHGYMFKTEPFKTYFNNRSWYKPNAYFKQSDLNNIEVYNIEVFLRHEKM